MIVFPAIDLRNGACVRLRQGDPDAETVFSQEPAAMARHWVDQGAEWLHVVNLDGALGQVVGEATEVPVNVRAFADIRRAVDVPVQFGGGIRSVDDVGYILDLGATRVILGTVAVREPNVVQDAILKFGADRVVAGLDARGGMVATHGWQEQTDLSALEVARRMKDMGVELMVYTDIARDAMLTGVNLRETADLARGSGLNVIASGGIGSLADVQALLELEEPGIIGFISGQALYTGALKLPEAIAACNAGS